MHLPKITDLSVSGKKVLLRLDLDCDPDLNDLRIKASEETLDYLKNKNSEIIIIGHKGRPQQDGVSVRVREELSLKPFQPIFDKWGAKVEENLRFDPGEESNDPEFAKKLASLGEVYVNEAFGSSHREHASIVGLPKLLPHAVGFRFAKEVENLSKIFTDPVRPLVFIISGIKEDKLQFIDELEKYADKILVGGRLPELLGDKALESVRLQKDKVIVGNLVMDKEDITLNTIDRFVKEIKLAKTIVLAGVLGKYEDEGHRMGTEKVFSAVADSQSFKIVGGGDSLEAVRMYNLENKFSWISVGGGAMLEFLSKKTLPGLEALIQKVSNSRSNKIKEDVGTYLKDLLLQDKLTLDDAQRYAGIVDRLFRDEYTDDQLLENTKRLDDNDPVLTPIVMKLLGGWNI